MGSVSAIVSFGTGMGSESVLLGDCGIGTRHGKTLNALVGLGRGIVLDSVIIVDWDQAWDKTQSYREIGTRHGIRLNLIGRLGRGMG